MAKREKKVEGVVVMREREEVDLRDPANRELKRIADRLSRYARDNWNRAIFVEIFADVVPDNQRVDISVALPVEEVKEEEVAKDNGS